MADTFSISTFLAKLTVIIIAAISFSQCSFVENKASLKNYYFPFETLQEGLVYEYHSVDGKMPIDYVFVKSHDMDTAIYITAQYYNEQFEVRQFSREEIVDNGVMVLENFIYQSDSLGQQNRVEGEVIQNSAFPFSAIDSNNVFLMEIKWTFQEEPESSLTLIRNRRFLGKTNFRVNNVEHDCIKIDLKELVNSREDGDLERTFNGIEYYAKGIGLVYYKKEIEKDFILEYQLYNRYSMAEFQEKFKTTLETN